MADDHRGRPYERLDARFGKACLVQPLLTIGSRVVETTGGFYQHVETHEEPERVLSSRIVDDRVVDDERSTVRQCLICTRDQRALLAEIPVMKDMAHDDDVSFGEWITEKVAGLESYTV